MHYVLCALIPPSNTDFSSTNNNNANALTTSEKIGNTAAFDSNMINDGSGNSDSEECDDSEQDLMQSIVQTIGDTLGSAVLGVINDVIESIGGGGEDSSEYTDIPDDIELSISTPLSTTTNHTNSVDSTNYQNNNINNSMNPPYYSSYSNANSSGGGGGVLYPNESLVDQRRRAYSQLVMDALTVNMPENISREVRALSGTPPMLQHEFDNNQMLFSSNEDGDEAY